VDDTNVWHLSQSTWHSSPT